MPKPTPRIRKRRVLDRLRQSQQATATSDAPSAAFLAAKDAQEKSAAVELQPSPKAEKDARRAALREELRANAPQSKISRKKAARLEKYIDLKLKKEESAEIVRKLAAISVDLGGMTSVGELGKGKRAILGNGIAWEPTTTNGAESESQDEEVSQEDGQSEVEVLPKQNGSEKSAAPFASGAVFGGGLKRPLEMDSDGRPVLHKRVKTKAKILPKFLQSTLPTPGFTIDPSSDEDEPGTSEDEDSGESDESEWGGFESESQDGAVSDEPSDGNSEESDLESTEESELETDEEDIEDPVTAKVLLKARSSAFKAWAEKQRNETIGFQPSNQLAEEAIKPTAQHTPRPFEQDPLPSDLALSTGRARTAHAVRVTRSEEMQDARIKLPVVEKEQQIMEAIFHHDVVIISGATGSGKTTQVPQFLFENGFGDSSGPTPGMIGITQPRRVAAVSMAKRVAEELGDKQAVVAHQIRFDTTVKSDTAIKFMTDGVLLRELSEDFSLQKYSAIVVDEAHERTINTDILISLMSRCVKARAKLAHEKPTQYTPLKLIIMSATLRVSDFRENSRLFKDTPPLVEAEGRQFDVTVHWARRTAHEFLEDLFRKVSRGHKQLPPGGILVFLPGQNDIRQLAHQLKGSFPTTAAVKNYPSVRVSAEDMPIEGEDLDLVESGNQVDVPDVDEGFDSDLEIEGLDDEDDEFKIENESPSIPLKMHILPLYSQLPSKEQLKVFQSPPEGSRMIILATNVAETSLTIPGIKYVFDSGRVKERRWDRAGVQTFHTTWVSKASADQRMGRAGRTGTGHCYRLYSSAVYETFTDYAEPEIYRSPLEGVVLQLKSLNVARVDIFPFPTPPDASNIAKAETVLKHLGALDGDGAITLLGRELQSYPLSPRFAQMLRLGRLYNCLEHVIATVSALDVPELFVSESLLDVYDVNGSQDQNHNNHEFSSPSIKANEARKNSFNASQSQLSRLCSFSDAVKLLAAVKSYSEAEDSEAWCEQYFARSKALKETNQLREQLTSIIRNVHSGVIEKFSSTLKTPSEKQIAVLRQIVAAGFIDQVAIRADLLPSPPPIETKPKRAIDVKYQTLFPSVENNAASEQEKFVYLHPSSVLARKRPTKLPPFVVYHRLQKAQYARNNGIVPKTRMHPLTSVSGQQLAVLARGTNLLQISKPRTKVTVLRSVDGNERRQCLVDLSLAAHDIDVGWFLCQKEVVQRRTRHGWVIEEYAQINK